MPGAKVHDATGTKEKMESILYKIGLNAPNDFKELQKYYGNNPQQLVDRYSEYQLTDEEKRMLPTEE